MTVIRHHRWLSSAFLPSRPCCSAPTAPSSDTCGCVEFPSLKQRLLEQGPGDHQQAAEASPRICFNFVPILEAPADVITNIIVLSRDAPDFYEKHKKKVTTLGDALEW